MNAGTIASLTLLAGCGGGGGGGLVSTPPPPATNYTTLANATSSTTLSTKASVYEFERLNNASAPTIRSGATSIEVVYDSTTKTYTLRGTPMIGSTSRIEQSFGPSDAAAGLPSGNYDKTAVANGNTQVSRLQVGAPANLTYAGYGHWTVGSTVGVDQRFDDVYFTYGVATQTADMPKTGSATYTLGVGGQGAAPLDGRGTLSANFGAGTVNVSLETQFVYRANQTFSPFATLTGSGAISANGFSTQLSGNGYTGSIDGLFYGPAAAEVGGALTIAKDGGVVAAGYLLGRKD
ncbi:transferrin-binding protein-like solute binding protein [Sphingomonas montanisoli]|uniref:Transferrin-binding protein-like solute binding protein n=1 Tax=Sphingomonas montanisoli TaxID=2606412 RepID=A0A5D9C4C1_9SPHN|nr:transferrin-binding protein-like solute binding protein [Sphingomonas montanisoli]TZG26107.1 transferrin-binding protein-like solute binding protein [Sphingomonas montanisoli]